MSCPCSSSQAVPGHHAVMVALASISGFVRKGIEQGLKSLVGMESALTIPSALPCRAKPLSAHSGASRQAGEVVEAADLRLSTAAQGSKRCLQDSYVPFD